MQVIFGDRWDFDKPQTCAKWKSILEFRSVWKEIQKIQKIKTEQKVPKSGSTEPPLYIMGARDSKCLFSSCKYDFLSKIDSFLVPGI